MLSVGVVHSCAGRGPRDLLDHCGKLVDVAVQSRSTGRLSRTGKPVMVAHPHAHHISSRGSLRDALIDEREEWTQLE